MSHTYRVYTTAVSKIEIWRYLNARTEFKIRINFAFGKVHNGTITSLNRRKEEKRRKKS